MSAPPAFASRIARWSRSPGCRRTAQSRTRITAPACSRAAHSRTSSRHPLSFLFTTTASGRTPQIMKSTLTRAVLAGAFVAAAVPAFAQLNRVGPVGTLGYPDWYQDKTGLTLEFCDSRTQAELEGGWCVLLAPD